MKNFFNKQVLIYLFKFIGAFCFLYYGTLTIIGLSSPGGYYSEFVARYLNFIPAFRNSLLSCSEYFLALLGYESHQAKGIQLLLEGGGGVSVVYSCLGYGITSFWLAFVFANTGSWKKKFLWMVGGATALYIINVLRMSLVALASHKRWSYPFGWDHHTWFNIVAYCGIFLMMWIYDRKGKAEEGRG